MQRILRFAVFGWSMILLPAASTAQVAKPAPVDVEKVRAKLLAGTFIEGKLTALDEEEKRFKFQHHYQVKTPNPDVQRKLAALTAQFNAALLRRSTSLEELKKMQADGMALEKAAFNVEEIPIVLELKGDKNLVIRTLIPPAGPDGKPKRLTPAEEKKLKGDPRYPGYQATLKDLDAKQTVRVYLDKTKPKPPAGTKPEETIYPISMIVIVPEPQPVTAFKIPGE